MDEPDDATPFLPERRSAILRSRTDEDRLAERHAFTEDLRVVAQALAP